MKPHEAFPHLFRAGLVSIVDPVNGRAAPRSPEERAKISAGLRKVWRKRKQQAESPSERALRIQAALRKRRTGTERKLVIISPA